MTTMHRNHYNPNFPCEHAGLFLLKGFKEWKLDSNSDQVQGSDGNHNKDISKHHRKAANEIPMPDHYKQAYERWKMHLVEQDSNCGHWFGKLTGRLYLGLGEASPLEAGITLHHTYGVPFLPGTAVKGVLHHYALAHGMDEQLIQIIFGVEPELKNNNSGEAGHVIFNDAWWVPGNGKPLAPEVITVHHPNYYKSDGERPATDFDDPNPNPQIAVRGSFHFSFLADKSLHDVVKLLLAETLQHAGIGGKTSSGYGMFIEDTSTRNDFEAYKADHDESEKIANMPPMERYVYAIEKTSDNPAVTLLKALEDNKWPDPQDQDTVARKIQEIMRAEGKWKPYSNVTGKKGLKLKERSLKVMSYFLEKD